MGNAKSYFHFANIISLHFHCLLYNSIQQKASWVVFLFVFDLVVLVLFLKNTSEEMMVDKGTGMRAQRV